MPRRNNTKKIAKPTPVHNASLHKIAYLSRRDAEQAANDQMLYDLDLRLAVYQEQANGKWYLTSQEKQ